MALAAAGCGSTKEPIAKLPIPRGKLIRVAVTKPPAQRVPGVAFVKADPHRALELFRRGKLDVAPVPLGDIQAVLRDPQLRPAVRITRLQARDVVVAQPGGVLVQMPELMQVYSDTADRADYQALVSELQAPAADLSGKPSPRAAAVAYSRARRAIARLPRVAVRFAQPSDPELAYGLDVLVAAWRDVGLGAYVGQGTPDATFERSYPTSSLRPAQRAIPIAWAVDAHLVSARVKGWRESDRGVVDYRALRFQDRRRHP